MFGNAGRLASMVLTMKNHTIHFGEKGEHAEISVARGIEQFLDNNILADIQAFVDHIPSLSKEEAFYFGFWRMTIEKLNGKNRLCEWNFEDERFCERLNRSVCLWHAQVNVLSSQDLPFTSVGINDWLHFSPSVFSSRQESTVEGVRDKKNVQNGSGWILYTASDRQNNLPFESMQLHEALKIFNVNILRFLGLPDGWAFNLEVGGESHIWEEALVDSPPN